MKLSMYSGFSRIVLRDGWDSAIKKALSYGVEYVETIEFPWDKRGLSFPDVEAAKKARELLSANGLSVSCCSLFSNIYKSPETVNFLKEYSERVAACGSPFMHHTLLPWLSDDGTHPSFDEGIEIAVDAAEEIANYAANFGVTCIYEDQGLYINGRDGFHKFFDELKLRCRNVGICGDIGNSLFADLAPNDFFAEFINDIKYVHVKEFAFFKEKPVGKPYSFLMPDGSYLAEAPFGEGVCEIDACMDILKNAGYQGVVSIETEDVAPAIEYLKKFNF